MGRQRRRGTSVQVQWEMRGLESGLTSYSQRAQDIPYEICRFFAPQVEAEAKQNAEWIDRTGNARQSLRAQALEIKAGAAALLLIHGMPYGRYLELSFQGRYAIIGPTLESYYPRVKQMMRDVVK